MALGKTSLAPIISLFRSILTPKTVKNQPEQLRGVPYHGANCSEDNILVFRKRSRAVGSSQGHQDGAALPLDLGMAPAPRGLIQIPIFLH